MRIIAIALLTALAAASPLAAQDAGVSRSSAGVSTVNVSSLKPAQLRRLDHYAKKLLDEIAALVQAQSVDDKEAETLHKEQLADLAGRYMKGATDAGLDRRTADAYFQATLAQNYTGKLPRVLISDSGIPSINGLLDGSNDNNTATAKSGDEDKYINYLRDEGENAFN